MMVSAMTMTLMQMVPHDDNDDVDDDGGVGDDDDSDGADGYHLSGGLLGLCCFVEAGFSPSPPPTMGGRGLPPKTMGGATLECNLLAKGLSGNRVIPEKFRFVLPTGILGVEYPLLWEDGVGGPKLY